MESRCAVAGSVAGHKRMGRRFDSRPLKTDCETFLLLSPMSDVTAYVLPFGQRISAAFYFRRLTVPQQMLTGICQIWQSDSAQNPESLINTRAANGTLTDRTLYDLYDEYTRYRCTRL